VIAGAVAIRWEADRYRRVQVLRPSRPQPGLEAVAKKLGRDVRKEEPERVPDDARDHVELSTPGFFSLIQSPVGEVRYFVTGVQ
jgi:hypothetical protein